MTINGFLISGISNIENLSLDVIGMNALVAPDHSVPSMSRGLVQRPLQTHLLLPADGRISHWHSATLFLCVSDRQNCVRPHCHAPADTQYTSLSHIPCPSRLGISAQ